MNPTDLVDVAVATILAHASLSNASVDELLVMMGRVLGREAGKPELEAFLVELVRRRTLKRKAVIYNNQMSTLQQQHQAAQLCGDVNAAEALQQRKVSLFIKVLPVLTALLSMPDSST